MDISRLDTLGRIRIETLLTLLRILKRILSRDQYNISHKSSMV